MLQVVASPMIAILMTLEVSLMLFEKFFSSSITYDDNYLWLSDFYSTAHWAPYDLDEHKVVDVTAFLSLST